MSENAMSRFLLVVAALLGKKRAITPRRLSKCSMDAARAEKRRIFSELCKFWLVCIHSQTDQRDLL